MITHELLPVDPDDGEIFEVPADMNIYVSASIHLTEEDGNIIGVATSLDRSVSLPHLWVLRHANVVCGYTHEDLKKVVTALRTPQSVIYHQYMGWVPLKMRDKPLQQTVYTGQIVGDISATLCAEHFRMYDCLYFWAKGKGETK